ncbi:DUF6538 domain-containing protein [Dyella sp.]|uniref:DUF6538 domain-containing protein n=1 Tax=Dyella sp. TaxID=1869338 RepID=UPI002ED5FF66
MPKPLLLHRPAGLYVRFRVPTDLRERVGSRFLVRPLRQAPGEAARLAAALLDMALSNAFRGMRQGGGRGRYRQAAQRRGERVSTRHRRGAIAQRC